MLFWMELLCYYYYYYCYLWFIRKISSVQLFLWKCGYMASHSTEHKWETKGVICFLDWCIKHSMPPLFLSCPFNQLWQTATSGNWITKMLTFPVTWSGSCSSQLTDVRATRWEICLMPRYFFYRIILRILKKLWGGLSIWTAHRRKSMFV